MRHIKRALTLLLAVALLATTALLFASCGDEPKLEFELNSDGQSYTCTGFVVKKNREVRTAELVIPETYESLPVTAIGENAFSEIWVYTQKQMGSFGQDTSDYVSITSVTIPNSVTRIEESAFQYCKSLTSVTLPENLEYLGENAFSVCEALTTVNVPNKITELSRAAFLGCISLTTVTLSDTLTVIGEDAFNGCTSLASIEIPATVTAIGVEAFAGCAQLGDVTIPEGTTAIGDCAFMGCTSLKEMTIPTTVTEMGAQVFANTSEELTVNVSYDKEPPQKWNEKWYAGMKGKALNTSKVYYDNVVVPEQERSASLQESIAAKVAQYDSLTEQIESKSQQLKDFRAQYSINPPDWVSERDWEYQKEIQNLNQNRSQVMTEINKLKEQLAEYKITNQIN